MGSATVRVVKLGVYHRKGLSTLTPSGRSGRYYNAGILVLAYTADGEQVMVAKVDGLNNTEIPQKLAVVRQLFSELIGMNIFLRLRTNSSGGKIPFEIAVHSLPQYLQEICGEDSCYSYKKLDLLWKKQHSSS